MKLAKRIGAVLMNEGIAGVMKRLRHRLEPQPATEPAVVQVAPPQLPNPHMAEETARAEYALLVERFQARTAELGCGDLSHYYWYHTIDLGNGLVTPGDYDYRESLPGFGFPNEMKGMDVLDVGTATGFFAFSFEQRGANVVTVDLPSMAEWDIVTPEREQILRELKLHHPDSSVAINDSHLDGPFRFCHRMLGSKVEKVYSRVYDLSTSRLGRAFDLVYLGDVLPHVFSPIAALDAVARVCKRELLISLDLWENATQEAGLLYTGGAGQNLDNRSWWRPNFACLEQMLRRVGFKHVELAGTARSVLRRHHWREIERPVIRASK